MSTPYEIGFGAMQAALNLSQESFEDLFGTIAKQGKLILIDTARVYGPCEQKLGEVLRKHPEWRQYLFIVVKIGISFDEEQPYCLSKEELESHVTDSLQRLGLDNVNLIMLHRLPLLIKGRPNPFINEAIDTLTSFKTRGLCDYIGLSEVSRLALDWAKDIDFIEIAAGPFIPKNFNNGVIQTARDKGIKIISYGSICRGFLTYKLLELKNKLSISPAEFQQEVFDLFFVDDWSKTLGFLDANVIRSNFEILIWFYEECVKRSLDPFRVSIEWAVSQGFIPIPGTMHSEHFEHNMQRITLPEDFAHQITENCKKFIGDPNPSCLNYLNDI